MKKSYMIQLMVSCLLLLMSLTSYAQNGSISGTVFDEDTNTLPGASVRIREENRGVSTDVNGVYNITGLPDGSYTLLVTFMGYQTTEKKVFIANGQQVKLDIHLVHDAQSLDEVVVIGYGTQRKGDVTGAVSTVSPKEFNQGVVATPDQLLAGKVPGLTISRNSGDPTAGATIQLRGPSSLTAGTSPFYVIDGVPGANIDLVAPDDIVSMDVMKDASSTAIYGSRAANGVIFVTTKRGKEGAPILSYNAYAAVENVSRRVNVLSADEYLQFLSDNNISVAESESGYRTDWQDEIFRTGISHNHNISLTGGTASTRYNASVNYYNQEGIVNKNDIERVVTRLGVDQNAFDDKLRLSLNVSNSVITSNHVDYGIFNGAGRFVPVSPVRSEAPEYAAYGGYFQVPGRTNYFNPVAMLNQRDETRGRNIFLASAKAELDLLPGLVWTNIGSFQRSSYDRSYYQPTTDFASAYLGDGYAERSATKDTDRIFETYLNYAKTFNDMHNLELLAGYSYQQTFLGDGILAKATGFLSDDLGANNLDVANPPSGFRSFSDFPLKSEALLISFYGRAVYNYDGKYLINASLRRDGSSKFGVNNRWAIFPSVSAAWRISSETFMQNQELISDLKLRAGYGVSGNQNIDPYRSLTLYGQRDGYFLYNGQWVSSYGVNQNPNPDLKWESTTTINAGLDFELWKGRLSGAVDVYQKKTKDLLYTYQVPSPPYLFNELLANGASMDNKGIEIALNASVVSTSDFSWNTAVNFARNINKIGSLSGNIANLNVSERYEGGVGLEGWTNQTVAIVMPGMPIGTFYVAKYVGYDADARQTIYEKPNGDLVTQNQIVAPTDFQVMGHALPKFTYGWNNSFNYKKFDLGFFFRGVYGNRIFNATRADLSRLPQAGVTNLSKDAVEEGIFETPVIASSRFLEDGSFLRLDNATLGYTFNVANMKYLKSARVYLTGQNLFIITNYTGVDPEVNMGGLSPGIDDRNYYPQTRSFLLGVNVSF
ncbi:SusC/RagA family TonB-linked outer membrane protein [Olivibacter sitiensis]|uniref:SusC/RagA family TonB-linked outer membrane protein n=1 Tax=Olivibacter sitiensis TaxID=376470 RepID=UPI0004802FEA|nr:TonB-dependent receptor [Olivibacter sitiensis]